MNTIIDIGQAESFIIALCELIHRLVIDRLHVLGDIYDRGPAPHLIMEHLSQYHSVDIQWGNHDMVWMGAAAGQDACIASVIRICTRYGNLETLEEGYGINLIPLMTFALQTYKEDACDCFQIRNMTPMSEERKETIAKMQKAISIIQFKLEGQTILRRPDFSMNHRLLLDKIDYDKHTIMLEGKEYELLDHNFPTINPERPYELTPEEALVVEKLRSSFTYCDKLQKHVQLLLNKGGMYKVYNNNLLYHGCIPLNQHGDFQKVSLFGKIYEGRELYEELESYVRKAFFSTESEEKEKGKDMIWFIWNSPNSPLFGKSKMATFERYFLKEEETHQERKNDYYQFLENPEVVERILKEFGLSFEDSHIVNGHVPVRLRAGESPIKCNGKVLLIDGGFSEPYQQMTGIAGYTLIYNAQGLFLAAHEPFVTTEQAILQEADIVSNREIVSLAKTRRLVRDTDNGKNMAIRIEELKQLVCAYRKGLIKERQ